METLARAVPTCVAAKLIGKSEDYIRWGLQQERLPIGRAVKSMRGNRWNYYVSPQLLSEFTGVPVDTINRLAREYRERRQAW